jgi:hypothetical protein
MATNYQRGRAFEYRTRDKLYKDGAVYVMRAAQSKGKVDLIALFPPVQFDHAVGTEERGVALSPAPRAWLIQCKRDGRLPKVERDALLQITEDTGFPAYLASCGPKGRGVVFQRLSKEAQ